MKEKYPEEFVNTIVEHIRGGFAPLVILLREFDFQKSGVVLDGLHFSAFSLLQHMHHRQRILLDFLKNPESNINLWPEGYWPQNFKPGEEREWINAIDSFEKDVEEMVKFFSQTDMDLFKIHPNGSSVFRAVVVCLHHNSYHIGQLKTIGRQLGVW